LSALEYPKITEHPLDVIVPRHEPATLNCKAEGIPTPIITWFKDGEPIKAEPGSHKILLPAGDRSLRIDDIAIEDMGEYSCEADNAVGSITASGTLVVHCKSRHVQASLIHSTTIKVLSVSFRYSFLFRSTSLAAPPSFLVRPKNVLIEPGSEALFECQATGHPHPTLFWSVEGNRTLLLPGSRMDNLEVTQNADGTSVLSIAQVGRMDNGKVIVCSAVNSVGSVSTRVVLSVNLQDDRPPPLILQGPCNQTLPIKSVAILPCKASGIPPPVISWYKDGIPVLSSEKINITESGTLTIADLSKIDDSGLYTCVASSKSGKTTW
ncbi:AGAP010245-PA, partial [Anopheles gambiae str. PEST]